MTLLSPSRTLDLPLALLLELQRIKDTVRCAVLGTEVPGHHQEQLTKAFSYAFVQNLLVFVFPKILGALGLPQFSRIQAFIPNKYLAENKMNKSSLSYKAFCLPRNP